MYPLDNGASPSPSGPAVDVERRRTRLSMAMAVLVVLVGAAALVASRELEYWTALGPGPGFFPMWLGGLLCAFGAVWLVQLWRRRRRFEADAPAAAETDPAAAEEAPPEYSLRTVVAILVSLCALAATLEVLGYQLSMLLFLLFHLLVLGRRRLLLSLTIALIGSFGVFVAFTRLLAMPLPASSIPFLRDLGL